jgi:glycoside/pentoside/hexuronide:cation symporter, GPH family
MTLWTTYQLRYKAALALPLGMAGLPVYMLAPALYNTLGLSLTVIGISLMMMRLIDVFLDPTLGRMIDKGVPLMPYALTGLIIGLPALFVGHYFMPPNYLLALLCISSLVISLSLSVLSISLYASHHQSENRQALTPYREGLLVVGVVLGAFLPPVLTQILGDRWGYLTFSLIFIATLLLVYRPLIFKRHEEGLSFRAILTHKPLLKVLTLVLVNGIPTAITSVLFFYFTQYVVKTTLAPAFLLLFFASGVISMGFWVKKAELYGELKVLIVTIGLSPLVFFIAYFVQAGDLWLFAFVCIASGIVFGGDAVLLPLIISKTIGEVKGGFVFGINAFLTKFTNALAVGLILPFITALGFSIEAPDNTTPIRLGYVLIPVAFKLLSFALILYLKRISK